MAIPKKPIGQPRIQNQGTKPAKRCLKSKEGGRRLWQSIKARGPKHEWSDYQVCLFLSQKKPTFRWSGHNTDTHLSLSSSLPRPCLGPVFSLFLIEQTKESSLSLSCFASMWKVCACSYPAHTLSEYGDSVAALNYEKFFKKPKRKYKRIRKSREAYENTKQYDWSEPPESMREKFYFAFSFLTTPAYFSSFQKYSIKIWRPGWRKMKTTSMCRILARGLRGFCIPIFPFTTIHILLFPLHVKKKVLGFQVFRRIQSKPQKKKNSICSLIINFDLIWSHETLYTDIQYQLHLYACMTIYTYICVWFMAKAQNNYSIIGTGAKIKCES